MGELTRALSLVALIAATLQYTILMRHREERRDALRWQQAYRDSLMSARRLLDPPSPVRRWTDANHFTLQR